MRKRKHIPIVILWAISGVLIAYHLFNPPRSTYQPDRDVPQRLDSPGTR